MNTTRDFQQTQVSAWEAVFENCFSLEDYLTNDPWIGIEQSPFLPYVLKYITPNARILESGCGQAQWVYYLEKKGYRIFGFDFASSALQATKEKYPQLTLACGDVTKTAFRDEAFGTIISWSVVDHLEGDGPLLALHEMYRTLEPGGTLLITVPCKNYLYSNSLRNFLEKLRGNRALRRLFNKSERQSHFIQREFSRREFSHWIRQAGFNIREVIPSGHEVGFAKQINLYLPGRVRLFYRDKISKRWSGLSPTGQLCCDALRKISPWITPDEMLFVAVKGVPDEDH